MVAVAAFGAFAPAPAGAGSFVGVQTGPTEWTYTLTYDPFDNYAVCPFPGDIATITLSGLSGVVTATPPATTDFPPGADLVNLQWMPQVTSGGTAVTWTHEGPGTGNFPVAKHVYGFKIFTATPSMSGVVNVASSGFSLDVSVTGPCPVQPADDRDFTGTTVGPVSPDVNQQLADLATSVAGVGPGTSLFDKITDARTAFATNEISETCSILNAFINQVNAQSGKSIREETATELVSDAARIRAELRC
ncbi:MAG TPA: hypothetical protein VH108_09160 [Gaiellaceae bacterium]|nr:hypothetical protein [Gaiellaceae bacterium]